MQTLGFIFTRVQMPYMGENAASSGHVAGILGSMSSSRKLDLYLFLGAKVHSKYLDDCKGRPQTLKLLGENTWRYKLEHRVFEKNSGSAGDNSENCRMRPHGINRLLRSKTTNQPSDSQTACSVGESFANCKSDPDKFLDSTYLKRKTKNVNTSAQ